MSAQEAKQKRARLLGNLTRLRRQAYVVVESSGSRTRLISLISELNGALGAVQEANDCFISFLTEDEEKNEAQKYYERAETQYEEVMCRIEDYLKARKGDPPSVVSEARSQSQASDKSDASRQAEIARRVKELEVVQLERRQKLEKEEYEIKQKRELQEARDAAAAAELEERLMKAAEDDLGWERRDDFPDQAAVSGPLAEVTRPDNHVPLHDPPVVAPSVTVPGPSNQSLFQSSLPKLTLHRFDGNPKEWVRWFSLFEALVHNQETLSSAEKMAHLQGAVGGLAQQCIQGMLYRGDLYEAALTLLKDRFGREEDIVSANLREVFACPSPSYLDPASLERFQASLHCAISVFQTMGYDGDLSSFENLRRIVQKLPPEMKKDWSEHILALEPQKPTLVHLDAWLNKQVRVALNLASVSSVAPPRKGQKQTSQGQVKSAAQRTSLTTVTGMASDCVCCSRPHVVTSCPDFLRMGVDDRARAISSSGCCFYCLKRGHRVRNCRQARTCGVDGCQLRHHQLLHGSQRITRSRGAPTAEPPQGASRVVAAASAGSSGAASATLLQVVPVIIIGDQGKSKEVYALLDPGSQTSLLSEEVMEQLGLDGEEQELHLRNVESCGRPQLSKRLQLDLFASRGNCTRVTVPEAFSVKNLNIRTPQVQVRPEWHHVSGLDIPDCSNKKVDLLLGANVLEAVLQLEVRTGYPGQPVAIRTLFGWTLTGSVADLVPDAHRSVMFIHKVTPEHSLCLDLQEWWSTESFGSMFKGEAARSQEDLQAQKILDKTTRTEDGRYEVGLLWKDRDLEFPDNRKMAARRLLSLEKSLFRDPAQAEAYDEALMSYVAKGHARKVSPEELRNPTQKRWMLPHHAVVSANKSKIRVVFDAAARFQGMSLNDALITGPDLLRNLVGVLIRFREERVALVADVEQMFHQVRVKEQDQAALSFLWRNMDQGRAPDVYQMMVVIFGAKCSPTLANYALRRTADDNQEDTEISRAAAAVVHANFYMDDLLVSVPDEERARGLKEELTRLVAKGGFNLTKWASNRPEAVDAASQQAHKSGLELARLGQGTQRALGCVWRPEEDILGVKLTNMSQPATKRGVLSRLPMVFDPLGLVSPFVLRAKALVQRLWAKKYAWDQPLVDQELIEWEKWLSDLPTLEFVQVPRCYRMRDDEAGTERRVQLHIFCDASETAFGAAGYFRLSSSDGHSTCFVMSRTRLAPLKQLTIVRLELQAAVLGVRLADLIKRETTYHIDETLFWTDSAVVLRFLQNESRRFHTFVSNRIAEVQHSSEPDQWHHVPSQDNPADVCSRGLSGRDLLQCGLWWEGPGFLTRDREEWPGDEAEDAGLEAELSEVKTREAVFTTCVSDGRLLDPARYSSWQRYKRVVAWVIRFGKNARCRVGTGTRTVGPLTVPELIYAEERIIKESQRAAYGEELAAISCGGRLPAGSSLQQLSPFTDERGLIRARGRLLNSPLPESSRYPLIVGENDLIRLIVTDVHERVLHSGIEHTLSEVRLSYWIPKARSAVRKLVYKCAYCRNRRAQPQAPIMADLPASRFDMSRPFACVGIDYFGPLTIKKFRKTEKRYVLLVTCLSTRALHLELAASLDTDGFLMAFRRFVARRGRPRMVLSDNGTNLVAGEKEMRTCIEEWNQDQITDELTQKNIEWRFNPPTASHMGGVWERLVASVKRSLRVVLGNQCVSEDVLHTALLEVEFLLNSRPLTYASAEIDDAEPLTPNHFILGYPEAVLPPGRFSDSDTCGRGKWRQSQALANQLWRRWQREYLPLLICRKKWTQDRRNFKAGDVVLMVEQGSPRGYWPLARVMEVGPSADGTVRAVKVRTASGTTYVRPANKICFLESVN